ncbi:hypothetical protein [Nocardia carnea]|uniref:hypothetical protein n=1 Tax=Nocardia carnea TaxID=37328 RepID=UPI002453B46F|nr:hypothetical protein [Nocardia carnea]
MTDGRDNDLSSCKPDELLAREGDLIAVRDRLAESGAGDVATEVAEILSAIATYREQVERQQAKLGEVLRAVESLDSGNGDEEHVREVIARFRTAHD